MQASRIRINKLYLNLTIALVIFILTPAEIIDRVIFAPINFMKKLHGDGDKVQNNETVIVKKEFDLDTLVEEKGGTELDSVPVLFFHLSTEPTLDLFRACAIKIAAKLHPRRIVKVYSQFEFRKPKLWNNGTNIRVYKLSIPQILDGTPLQDWYENMEKMSKATGDYDTIDALKYAYLAKFGGIVLDTDILVLKSLEGFNNTIGMLDKMLLTNSVMLFEARNPFIEGLHTQVPIRHNPGQYGSLGPRFLAEAARQHLEMFPPGSNPTLNVVRYQYFNPISESSAKRLFKADEIGDMEYELESAYTVHLHRRVQEHGGKELLAEDVEKGSFVDKLFSKYCYR